MNRKTRQSKQGANLTPHPKSQKTDISPNDKTTALPKGTKVSITESSNFSGPLPLPATLDGYEKVLPGSAERIVAMAEREQEHRISTESRAIGFIKGKTILSFLLSFAHITGAVIVSVYGSNVVGGILGGPGLIFAIIALLGIGKSQQD